LPDAHASFDGHFWPSASFPHVSPLQKLCALKEHSEESEHDAPAAFFISHFLPPKRPKSGLHDSGLLPSAQNCSSEQSTSP
jgi:hypothetical protein